MTQLPIILFFKLISKWVVCGTIIVSVLSIGPWQVVKSFYLLTVDENRRQENPFRCFAVGSLLIALPLVIGVIRFSLSSSGNPLLQQAATAMDVSKW